MGTKTPTETAGDEDTGVLVKPNGVVEPELGEGVVGGFL